MSKKKCTAVVLAAGSGSRMKSSVAKQFMLLCGKPLIFYALQAVEQSNIIDDCILVTGENDISYVKSEIVEKFHFQKVRAVIAGGDERFASVANAMQYLAKVGDREAMEGYVFIHDGARPMLNEEMLVRLYTEVEEVHACVAAMPSKDTVKIVDEEAFALTTPERKYVWTIQTPQVFDAELIINAYAALMEKLPELKTQGVPVTDDASVVELFTDVKVKMTEGSYQNIKVTTPEDLRIAELFLEQKR